MRGDEGGGFRADVEGLRAVAVVAVVLFHAGVPGTTGGYVGVDVFFVLSGFLITGLLLREVRATGRVDLARFYARRVRRLLPAAAFVIAATVLASAALLSPLRAADVAKDGALYTANYRFATVATDYFAPGEPSPLLHFWSLAVDTAPSGSPASPAPSSGSRRWARAPSCSARRRGPTATSSTASPPTSARSAGACATWRARTTRRASTPSAPR